MLDVLPQLAGGCINYWEAGNWALNDAADPKGRKDARAHRQMHLHLLGRSPSSADPAWAWASRRFSRGLPTRPHGSCVALDGSTAGEVRARSSSALRRYCERSMAWQRTRSAAR